MSSPITEWYGETRRGTKRRRRATAFGSLLSASLHPDIVPPIELLQLHNGRANYWLPNSQDALTEPYPDDLDDTAIVVGHRARQGILTPQEKAAFTRLLITQEECPGGPYRTWCTADTTWHDVDPVVNANVAWALSQCGVTLTPLSKYLQQAWEQDQQSPYYPQPWVTRALLLRALPEPRREQYLLKKHLKQDLPHTPLAQAAARISSQLCGLSCPTPLVAVPAWEPLITEKSGHDPAYSGSAFATKLWLQAAQKQAPREYAERPLYAAYRTFHVPQSVLWEPFVPLLQRLQKADKAGVLAGIARHAAACFKLETQEFILQDLEEATIWGWLTYTLADQLFDVPGDPHLIPALQWATRQTVAAFTKWDATFSLTVDTLLTRVDQANTWEMAHGRLHKPSTQKLLPLSERSIAHMLGPLGVLHAAGIRLNDPEAQAVLKVGEAYLSLRQHLDDAHDWLDDHRTGIRTATGDVVRRAATSNAESALQKAYATQGVRYVLKTGKELLHQWQVTHAALPLSWQEFLQPEYVRLEAALTTFDEAVQFTTSLRATSSKGRALSKGKGRDRQG